MQKELNEKIEELKKDFWKDLATGGMTASTPDQAPEGYADWQVAPPEALQWFLYRLTTLIASERKDAVRGFRRFQLQRIVNYLQVHLYEEKAQGAALSDITDESTLEEYLKESDPQKERRV